VGKLVSNNKRQSDPLTEEDISKVLEEERESDVISEISDDFSVYNGLQEEPSVQVLSHRLKLKN
jgi:hypothetical protein